MIINQSSQYNINERKAKQLKQDIKWIKESNYNSCFQKLMLQMNEKEKRLVKISTEKGQQIDQMRQDWTLKHEDFGIEFNKHFSI